MPSLVYNRLGAALAALDLAAIKQAGTMQVDADLDASRRWTRRGNLQIAQTLGGEGVELTARITRTHRLEKKKDRVSLPPEGTHAKHRRNIDTHSGIINPQQFTSGRGLRRMTWGVVTVVRIRAHAGPVKHNDPYPSGFEPAICHMESGIPILLAPPRGPMATSRFAKQQN